MALARGAWKRQRDDVATKTRGRCAAVCAAGRQRRSDKDDEIAAGAGVAVAGGGKGNVPAVPGVGRAVVNDSESDYRLGATLAGRAPAEPRDSTTAANTPSVHAAPGSRWQRYPPTKGEPCHRGGRRGRRGQRGTPPARRGCPRGEGCRNKTRGSGGRGKTWRNAARNPIVQIRTPRLELAGASATPRGLAASSP